MSLGIDTQTLMESFAEFAKGKKIDRATFMKIIDEVFRTIIRRQYGNDENFDVIINIDKGDLEIWRKREIVADDAVIEDPNTHIRLSDARKVQSDFEVGEVLSEEITIESFGRRLVQTARQTLIQRVRDIEKYKLYNKYKDLEGEIITCEVYQVLKKEIIVTDGEKNELSLPKTEQIYKDRFKKGDSVRAVVHHADLNNGNPKIILSRTSPVFLEKLFESEIPEVYDGLISIRKVVREPGDRAKVAVESYDDRIDPVGACVGMKGSRIHSIVRELCNENIDVINYTDNLELYIARALAPASITSIKIEGDRASVYLKRDQISMAIGKGGQNIRLASRLIGLEIDVFRDDVAEEEEEDVDLDEFNDVVEDWVIEELKKVGFDTAKSVLYADYADIVRRTDLEESTIDELLDILRKEFE
jgi:N utilization substance protein A